ncbi:hypothetical protein HMPREF1487_09482 [Pseudomonas sp. HPB0071]|uniref:YqaJ viral recombinase family protein n=1 Tax=Pseudomonas luteola TaxID=47886 RepID=A0A2X2BYT7_PSELU|nr:MULTISPECIES: YqaJ viral recombinase family protein [Pseudomonas]ENA27003.1 hypothetical protein HMPREF1487_09482 [Pseudomonas sp. HPB0071]MBA1250170.1 hypothetical protein [Pseudomonas zeshuii]MBH3440921.1 YqaJ viral recombinase family protein [Pseudomonas luteola]SPY99978.1 Uncharacterised protein [Pseudomonas luteola]
MLLKQTLESLPQAALIRQEDATRWLEGVMRWHADRAPWHAKRLGGIGGSEMGAVIRGIQNLKGKGGFSNLQQVVESKLMMRLPSFETAHMRRGNALEHLARLSFLYRYQATQDTNALTSIASAKQREGYEWCIGNPDDFVIINGKRFLNDYKVPSTYTDDIDFDYEVQLHHYHLQARFAGIKVEGLLLTKLDLAPEIAASLVQKIHSLSQPDLHDLAKSIAKLDMPGFRVVSHVVDIKRDMHLDILDCGYHCWNEFVLKGQVPSLSNNEKLELDELALFDVAQYQYQYALAKAGISHLEKVLQKASEGLTGRLQDVDIEDKEFPLSIVKIAPNGRDKERVIQEALARGATETELASEERKYSIVALIEEIKRLNGNPDAEHLYSSSLDIAKADAYLRAAGVDLRDFNKPGISLRLSTKKQDKEMAGVFERSAATVLEQWMDENSPCNQHVDGMDAIEEPFREATGTLQEAFADAHREGSHEITSTKRPTRSAGMR